MALHTGEPHRTPDGYAGIDLHRAARICAAGHGGSGAPARRNGRGRATGVAGRPGLRDLGAHRLKDLAQPERLYQLDMLGLPASLGHLAVQEGDYATARTLLEEGLTIRRRWGNNWLLAIALASLAEAVRCQGETSYAAVLCEESIALSRQLGDEQRLAWALHNRGQVALAEQTAQRAAALLNESLRLRQAHGNLPGVATSLAALAGVAAQQEAWERAGQLLGAATSLLEQLQTRLEPADQIAYVNTVAGVHAALSAEAFARAWAAGRSLSLEQVSALVVGR